MSYADESRKLNRIVGIWARKEIKHHVEAQEGRGNGPVYIYVISDGHTGRSFVGKTWTKTYQEWCKQDAERYVLPMVSRWGQ